MYYYYYGMIAAFKVVTFGIVTHLYARSQHPYFEFARPSTFFNLCYRCREANVLSGVAYILNVLSWVCDILIVFGVVTTGISADAGHAWAAGNRAYRPIEDIE